MNQYPAVGAASFSYDTRGNLTSNGTTTYSYDAYNRLTAAAGTATLSYDPANRLYQTVGAATTRFLYDGQEAIAEFNSSNVLQRRFVHGPGVDEPIVWYEGSGTTDRRWLIANEQGSVIAVTNGSGAALAINSYDEYGQPASGNVGRFQFTGQMWLPEAGLYNFKAREYSASLGRFMQTDPILQRGGLNIYAYVGDDPINLVDSTGRRIECTVTRGHGNDPDTVNVNGVKWSCHYEPGVGEFPARDPGEGGERPDRPRRLSRCQLEHARDLLKKTTNALLLNAAGLSAVALIAGANEVDTFGADTPALTYFGTHAASAFAVSRVTGAAVAEIDAILQHNPGPIVEFSASNALGFPPTGSEAADTMIESLSALLETSIEEDTCAGS